MKPIALLLAGAVGLTTAVCATPAGAESNEISALRLEMCEVKNPHFNGKFLRDAIADYGFASCAEYAGVKTSTSLESQARRALGGQATAAGTTALVAPGVARTTAFGTTWNLEQLPYLEHAKGHSTSNSAELHNLLDPALTTWGVASDSRGTAAVAQGTGATPKQESPLWEVLLALLGLAGVLGTLFFVLKPIVEPYLK